METTPCRTCGKEIADSGGRCPGCGATWEDNHPVAWGIIAAIIVIVATVWHFLG